MTLDVASATCFVNGAATGSNTGTSWRDAFTDLQSALQPGTCSEVWVAKGVYKPTTSTDREIYFELPQEMKLYGGFEGNESTLDERDPSKNVTVLSGDIDNNDNVDSAGIDESADDINGNNSFHVIALFGGVHGPFTAETIIDGFTITGGSATGTEAGPYHEQIGGGLYCSSNKPASDPTDVSCSPRLNNLNVYGNTASYEGGALFVLANGGSANPVLANSIFRANRAGPGEEAAVYVEGVNGGRTNAEFHHLLFEDNFGPSVSSDSGEFDSTTSGAEMDLHISDSTFIEHDCYLLVSTTATEHYGHAVVNVDNSTLVATNCNGLGVAFTMTSARGGRVEGNFSNVTFRESQTLYGPAILASTEPGSYASFTARNSIFWIEPTSDTKFPAISNDGGNISLLNSIVWKGCDDPTWSCSKVTSDDPLLGPLGNFGGFSDTLLPQEGSPAIDHGDDATCAALHNVDQRGVARPQGTHCDIGAVERQPIEDVIFQDGFERWSK